MFGVLFKSLTVKNFFVCFGFILRSVNLGSIALLV